MLTLRQKQPGFTIVELLIVIVVIAVLATISVVVYNGVQNRARNTKTIQAVAAWVKAIKLYHTDNDAWPTSTSCIGDIGSYDGDGKCWSPVANAYTVNATMINTIKPYMNNNVPTPDLTQVYINSTDFIRGGRYEAGGGLHSIYYVLSGTSDCPVLSGLNQTFRNAYSNGVQCGGVIP